MAFLQLPLAYLLWHYTLAWADLFRVYSNFVWFLWNFFSVRLLLSTFLSPWKRLRETGATKEAAGFVGRLILNAITRLVGIGARGITIGTGLLSIALLSLAFAAVLLVWLVLPFIPPFLVIGALSSLAL